MQESPVAGGAATGRANRDLNFFGEAACDLFDRASQSEVRNRARWMDGYSPQLTRDWQAWKKITKPRDRVDDLETLILLSWSPSS